MIIGGGYGAHIEKVEVNKAFIEGGKSVAFDSMIFTGGIISTPLVKKMDLEHNHLGQILVDYYLQVPDREGVFAIGYAAEIRGKKGDLSTSCPKKWHVCS